MTIKRDDLDKTDFSDVRSGRRLPPVHPGEILRDEFLTPLGMSVYALALAIKVPRSRVKKRKGSDPFCPSRARRASR
jgi:hypothetical protein